MSTTTYRHELIEIVPIVQLDTGTRNLDELNTAIVEECIGTLRSTGETGHASVADGIEHDLGMILDTYGGDSLSERLTDLADWAMHKLSDETDFIAELNGDAGCFWIWPDGLRNEPDDEDIVILSNEREAVVAVVGRPYAEANSRDELIAEIAERMDREKFWPNVWLERERGGFDLVSITRMDGDGEGDSPSPEPAGDDEPLTVHLKRWSEPGNCRYDFDSNRCTSGDGWAQVDTSEDAPYFGQWANPLELRFMTYAEGDCTLATAHSPESFAAYVRHKAKFWRENGHTFGIDAMCSDRIREAFEGLGLGDLLH